MSSELLDLKVQGEFSFRMSVIAERGEKEELQADCGRVVDLAKATVKDMCLLAWQLYQIKQKKHWQDVINPKTGFAFFNNTFADFCDYAFGFSKTKTSDLLRISQFVNPVGEIEAGYQSYNTSQLVELASIDPSHRGYFNSDMSVAEMRVAKDYVKNSGEFFEEKKKVGFDLLTKAQEWKENEKKSEPVKPDVMDGQMSLFAEDNEETDDDGAGVANPTSDLAELGEEVEAARELAHSAGLPFSEKCGTEDFNPNIYDGSMSVEDYRRMREEIDAEEIEQEYSYDADEYDEQDEVQEDMRGEMATIEAEAEESISQTPSVDLSNRAKIREFLNGYEKWSAPRCPYTFMKGYYYRFKNFMGIYAIIFPGCSDMEKMQSDHSTVRYYWKNIDGEVFEVTTRELERVIPLIKDEL